MTLTAGREMDALVAEKVMELHPCDKWTPINFGSAGGPMLRKNCEHENCYSVYERKVMLGIIGGPREYSTSIAAAAEVLEALRKKTCCLSLYSDHEIIWEVYWVPNRFDHKKVRLSTEESLPLAICIAALKVFSDDL